ncbi:MAG: hypothetical protein D6730_14980 [Bacteroidetes bacterium]|nr:MAG: hypothetical protein D6730_14980 [Bacteroidota bacterium]
MAFEDSEKFEVVEVEVWNDGEGEQLPTDIHHNLPQDQAHKQANSKRTTARQRRRARRQARREAKANKEPKYNWAFFLASLFIGIGFTATFGPPLGIFLGLGIGFLFFVDPIYEKIMDRIKEL